MQITVHVLLICQVQNPSPPVAAARRKGQVPFCRSVRSYSWLHGLYSGQLQRLRVGPTSSWLVMIDGMRSAWRIRA